jgi:hypothetical protein
MGFQGLCGQEIQREWGFTGFSVSMKVNCDSFCFYFQVLDPFSVCDGSFSSFTLLLPGGVFG